MPSSPLGSINGRTTSGVACHHRLWAAHTVKQRRAWHGITACGLDDTVGRRQAQHAFIALGRQTWSNDVGCGMPSFSLGSTDGRTASGIACHHRLWGAHKIEQRRALHAIITLGRKTWSNDVGRGMTSLHLDSSHCQQRRAWHADITALGLHTHSAKSGVA